MRYSIVGEEKRLEMPNGEHISTFATDCEMEFWVEIQRLRKALQNKQGDDLCWVEDPEKAKALPEAEFMESCRRYRAQIAEDRGVLAVGQMTIAQLEQRVLELEGVKSCLKSERFAVFGFCSRVIRGLRIR